MKAEDIKKAAGYAGMNITDLSLKIGQGRSNVYNKLRRGGIGQAVEAELESIAEAVGAKYYSYFEFPNGVKIGAYPEANKEEGKD